MQIEVRLARSLRAQFDAPPLVQVQIGKQAGKQAGNGAAAVSARDAVDALVAAQPGLGQFVLDDAGRMRRHVNLFINDQQLADRDGLSDQLCDGDQMYIVPAVSGGAIDATDTTGEDMPE